ncbi:hypothetical protein BVG19_g3691 [[Candida] boidinii]|nr:hypothetical protein BVG19_g3691 [[Candida] boidinii]OWB52495.1 hypothetical protein B5S27_g4071 [[Candida] boidinii]
MSEYQSIDQSKSIDIKDNSNNNNNNKKLIEDITNQVINDLIRNETIYDNFKKYFKILNDFKKSTSEIIFNENDSRLINCNQKITKENIDFLQDLIKKICYIDENETITELKEFEKSFEIIVQIQQALINHSIEFNDWYKVIPNKLGGLFSNPGNYLVIQDIDEFSQRFGNEISDWELKIIRIFNKYDVEREILKLAFDRVYTHPSTYNQHQKTILIEWSKNVIIQAKHFKKLIPIELVIKHILRNYKIKIDRFFLEEVIENNDYDKLFFYFEDKC